AGRRPRRWCWAIGLLAGPVAPAGRFEPPPPSPATTAAAPLSDPELDRYARHIVLRELGGPGQAALRRARVLVVGAGGLGAPVCLYLAAAGIGRITLADDDRVGLSNLQRQVIFRSADDGRPKAQAARDAMLALNPHVEIAALDRRIGAQDVALVAEHDLVLDGTDSFASRRAVNAACVAAGVPLIAGSIAQWEGQVTVWDPSRAAPCMACIFPEPPAAGLAPACAEAGVVGPLPGVVGSMMALEAIKLIAGAGQPLRGRMLIFDGLYGENRVMKIARRADCPVCGSGHFRAR
ncbi:HesA/MoeB/ThiF family protein, partial [Paracoccus thiocyanatus]